MHIVQQGVPNPVRLGWLLILGLPGIEVHEIIVLSAELLRLEEAFAPPVVILWQLRLPIVFYLSLLQSAVRTKDIGKFCFEERSCGRNSKEQRVHQEQLNS